MITRTFLVASVVLGVACTSYVIPVVSGPAKDVPDHLFGLSVGKTTPKQITAAGYALAEEQNGEKTYILGAPEQGIEEVEATATGDGATFRVEAVRVRFKQGRLASYRAQLDKLVRAHGAPQVSEEKKDEPLLAVDWGIERSRPNRFIVHRWIAPDRQLILVAGLEMEENLKSAMEYQLVLVPQAPLPE